MSPQEHRRGRSDGNSLLDLVAPLWSAEKTRRELGVASSSMQGLRDSGELIGLQATDGGGFAYPVFQFERRGDRVRVKPALRTFVVALQGWDAWSVAVMVKTPAPELGNVTPLEWVHQGGDEQTLRDYAAVLVATLRR